MFFQTQICFTHFASFINLLQYFLNKKRYVVVDEKHCYAPRSNQQAQLLWLIRADFSQDHAINGELSAPFNFFQSSSNWCCWQRGARLGVPLSNIQSPMHSPTVFTITNTKEKHAHTNTNTHRKTNTNTDTDTKEQQQQQSKVVLQSCDDDDSEESVRLNFRHSDKLTLVSSLSVTNVDRFKLVF